MNETRTFSIKPVGFSILLFFALALLLAGVYYATVGSVENGLRNGAQSTIEQWKGKTPKLGERIHLSNAGWSYIWAFRTGKKGGADEGIVYALRVTGNSGPYTAIFYQTAKQGTQFCGLAGIAGTAADADRYGITDRIIRTWISRLDTIESAGEKQ